MVSWEKSGRPVFAAFLGEFLRFSSERTHQRVPLLTLEVPEYWYDAKVVGRRQTLEEGEESKSSQIDEEIFQAVQCFLPPRKPV